MPVGFYDQKCLETTFLLGGHVDDKKQHGTTIKTPLEMEVDTRNNSFNNGGIFNDKRQ